MKVIGVTGGVGAGKSEVLRLMEKYFRARVIQADEVGRRLMEPGGATYERILQTFGREFALENGQIDREKLSREIFGSEKKRKILNGIVHPLVHQAIEEEIETLRQDSESSFSCAVVESAILAEGGLADLCDVIWYIHAPEEVRIRRVMETRGYSREKAESVIASQMKEAEYRKICGTVIENGRSLEETREQLRLELGKILDKTVEGN